jgi:lipoyl(octanoyl) transferase
LHIVTFGWDHLPKADHPWWLYQPGEMPFPQAWDWQKQLIQAHHLDPEHPDVLLLLQHSPVYTLGTGSSLTFLRFDPQHPPAPLFRIERGGEVTYHCPGQLVGYPILNLRRYRTDLHWYLRQLEEVIIQVLASYGLTGERLDGLTGVWVEGYKLAAIGIKVSRWITMHGFALNVCPDLNGFSQIIPCGIENRPVGSLAMFVPEVSVADAQERLLACFANVFRAVWVPKPLSDFCYFQQI